MDNEFIIQGIEDDRWLKAERLSERFLTELRAELERIGSEIVADNTALFPPDVSSNWNHNSYSSDIIAFARVQYRMNRVATTELDADPLRFNFGLRWDDPAKYSISGDGAACIPRYKLKNATQEDFEEVASMTREANDDIRTGPDPYRNAPGSFYLPITQASEVEAALRSLQSHFDQYGHLFGVEQRE